MADLEVAATGELPTQVTDRDSAMASAVANRNRQIAYEVSGEDVEGAGPEPQEERPTYREPPIERHEPAPAQPSMRHVDIDGSRHWVTDDQADQLLRLGMVTNGALRDYMNQPPPLASQEELRATAHQIQFGDEMEAANALGDLVNRVVSRVPRGPSEETVAARAVTLADERERIARDTNAIRNEFADIVEHPQRALLANSGVHAILARNRSQGIVQPDIEIWREAGQMVRDAMGGNPRQRSTPRESVARFQATNASSIVEKMRAARGQL